MKATRLKGEVAIICVSIIAILVVFALVRWLFTESEPFVYRVMAGAWVASLVREMMES